MEVKTEVENTVIGAGEYKLKKDLPTFKAGEVFHVIGDENIGGESRSLNG